MTEKLGKIIAGGLIAVALGLLSGIVVFHHRLRALEGRQDRLPAAASKACNGELGGFAADIRQINERSDRLEAAARVIAADADGAHIMIGRVTLALDAVARTTPWRARAPSIPKWPRPSPSGRDLLSVSGPP